MKNLLIVIFAQVHFFGSLILSLIHNFTMMRNLSVAIFAISLFLGSATLQDIYVFTTMKSLISVIFAISHFLRNAISQDINVVTTMRNLLLVITAISHFLRSAISLYIYVFMPKINLFKILYTKLFEFVSQGRVTIVAGDILNVYSAFNSQHQNIHTMKVTAAIGNVPVVPIVTYSRGITNVNRSL